MLYKLVVIFVLVIVIFYFIGGKNMINVDGISIKMIFCFVVIVVYVLMMVEISYCFKFKSELFIVIWWEFIIWLGLRVFCVVGVVISYNENIFNGWYFCLILDYGVLLCIIDIMFDVYDRMLEIGGFEIFINDYCGVMV